MTEVFMGKNLIKHLIKVSGKNDKEKMLYQTQKIGRRSTFCYFIYDDMIFALRADTTHEAVQDLIELSKTTDFRDLFTVENKKGHNPRLRISSYKKPDGWYCYYFKDHGTFVKSAA